MHTSSTSSADLADAALPRSTLILLSLLCGVSIGSAYYAQPLLPTIAHAFNVPEASIGLVPMLTQIGIAIGVVLLLPLGDIVDGKKLILGLLGAHIIALAAVSSARSISFLGWSSLLMGLTTVTPYVLPAFAAKLTPAAQRGQVTGLLARGVFAGILLARTASGYIGYLFNWRAIYWIAIVALLSVGVAFARRVPRSIANASLSYPTLLASLPGVFLRNRSLQIASVTQGLLFGGFNAFWITLAFYLESPSFHAPSYMSGLFGVIGLAGAAAAPMFGRVADKRGAETAVQVGCLITLGSWIVFALFGGSLTGLIAGVVLLDLGTTACHVSNQTIIYRLSGETRSRITALYVLGLFVGAAAFSPMATFAWANAGWLGVCGVGGVATLLATAVNFLPRIRQRGADRYATDARA